MPPILSVSLCKCRQRAYTQAKKNKEVREPTSTAVSLPSLLFLAWIYVLFRYLLCSSRCISSSSFSLLPSLSPSIPFSLFIYGFPSLCLISFRFKMPCSNIPTLLEYFIPHLPSMSYNSMYHAGAFLFLITWVFVCAGDRNLDKTIARLRNQNAGENPRARSGSGAFTKASQWKPDVFFPLPASVINRVLEIVNGEELWPDMGGGVWYIDISTQSSIGTDLGILLAPYWKSFRDEIRKATASRFYALVSS